MAVSALDAQSRKLEAEFLLATRDARRGARSQAGEQIAREVVPVAEWAAANGVAPPPENVPSQHAAEVDAFEARRAAAGMATSWSSAGLAAFNSWERAGSDPATLAKSLDIAPALEPRVGAHAAAQATTAYADEHRSFWQQAVPASNDNEPPESGEPLLPFGWESGLFSVWSAILDRRTCPACFGLDGTMVPVGKPFPSDAQTPLHNMCRCIVLVHFVPEALSKKLPGMGIDYEALKADVRDYYRGASARLTGVRHIADFLRGTAERTAPETLVRKVRERRGYRGATPPVALATFRRSPAVVREDTQKRAAPGYLKEQHTESRARAYERMLESRVTPEALSADSVGFRKLMKGAAANDFDFLREGMRAPLTAYRGARDANGVATGRVIPAGSSRPVPPVVIHSGAGGELTLRDGRHRLQAAEAAGATQIRAEIIQYDGAGDEIWRGTRNIPLPK